MHHCLRIAEVLREIVTLLRAGSEEGRNVGSLATIASLAVTCRDFNKIASDELWSELGGIIPLLKCFPEEVLGMTPQGVIVSIFHSCQTTRN